MGHGIGVTCKSNDAAVFHTFRLQPLWYLTLRSALASSLPFTLNVSGVRELTITATGRWASEGMSIGIYERHPKVCVADLMLQK